MSAPADATKSSAFVAPESPTTARPLEMDDDDAQESGVSEVNTAAASFGDVPPPKPPRPMTEHQKSLIMLKEAFPSIDEAVIKAVLTASGGRVEPAFNALLQMTDPEAARDDDQPPPQPPRPTQQPLPPSSTPMSQLEADELYARQLAEHYENVGAYEARTANPPQGARPRRQQTGFGAPDENYERERSFIDDDLPVIKESLRKGFIETQSKVNTWFTNLKKKIDDEFAEDGNEDDRNPQHGRMGRRPGEPNRRSADYDRYDADPQLLTDDFAGMKFHSDGTPARDQPPRANPEVFKPPPKSTSPAPQHHGRKVAFKEEVEDIDDLYDRGPSMPLAKDVPANKASKWQPLSTVEPNPIVENDPFSLGDSEDEKDVKEKSPPKAEGDNLQKATAEAMADSLVDSAPKKPGADGKND